jgi:hypothetical protein
MGSVMVECDAVVCEVRRATALSARRENEVKGAPTARGWRFVRDRKTVCEKILPGPLTEWNAHTGRTEGGMTIPASCHTASVGRGAEPRRKV